MTEESQENKTEVRKKVLKADTKEELDTQIRIEVLHMKTQGFLVPKPSLVGNEKCHCGSGKLYKNCHKAMDERVYSIAKEMGCAKIETHQIKIIKDLQGLH